MGLRRSFDEFIQDARFGVRNLSRNPGFAAIAMCSLALGIMATTAMYSVIYAVVLDPFPYKDVDSLMSVRVWDPGRGGRVYYTPDEFLEIAERNTIFEGVIASTISDVLWTGEGEPRRLRGNYVTTNTFPIMGVPPLFGRAITEADGAADAPPVAVLGYRFWQRQFGGDKDVLGRQMRLNDKVRTIVGVMPQRFMWRGADVYLPIVFHRGQAVEGVRFVHLLGRLKPGVTEAQAEADLRPIISELRRRDPSAFPDKWRVALLSFKETFPSSIRNALWILFAAVGLLLLIACSNVPNLLLSRGAARQKEIAVRASLGASRTRIVRQLMTENAILALASAVAGIVLAFLALKAIIALVPPNTIPDESHVAINIPVLLFTLAVSILTSLLFGIAPALHASTSDLASPLKESARGVVRGGRQAILRNGLVVAEVALSLMLLVGAGLMIRTLIAMQSVDLGFRAGGLLTAAVRLPERRYPEAVRRVAFFEELLRRVDSLPGVIAAGVNTGIHPLGNGAFPVEVVGSSQQDTRPVIVHQVNEGYVRALGIPLLRGRFFTAAETDNLRHFAVVNERFVQRYLNGDALGRFVRVPRFRNPPFNVQDNAFQVLGVVRDTLNRNITNDVSPELYIPFTITGTVDTLVVRTNAPPLSLASAIRQQVYAIDKDQPVMEIKTMDNLLDDWVYAGPRFNLVLFTVFAALGLTLASIGVYGVISNLVSQQTQEIGMRIALGASFGGIIAMVLSKGFRLLMAGVAVGLVGSFAGARLLAKQIWNVSPFDPLAFGITSLLLLLIGLQACFWPARRAARIDPMVALRHE